MDKKYVIKIFKLRRKSKDNNSRLIVVGLNTSKVNGKYLEKLGSMGINLFEINDKLRIKKVCSINLRRLGFWLNRGAIIKSKVSWLIGLLSLNDKSR